MYETVSLFGSNAMVLEYQLPSSFFSLAVSDILKDFSKWKLPCEGAKLKRPR